jgi:tetratricopeptide (TPR) repeat protein
MNNASGATISFPATGGDNQMWRLLPLAEGYAGRSPTGCRTFQLDARFESAGTWAGVNDLVGAAWSGLLDKAEHTIIEEHGYELFMVLPRYRDRIKPRCLCLTDTAAAVERTRFYSLERAWRVVHGLVGMVLRWKRVIRDERPWVIIVRNFDQAQYLAARFFTELARRATAEDAIEVILETRRDPSNAVAEVPGDFDPMAAEDIADSSEASLEEEYPRLLGFYRQHGDDVAAARLAFKVLRLYNRRGYYHEAASFIETILPCFDRLVGSDESSRMNVVSEMNSCLVATGDGDRARHIVEGLAVPYITRPHLLANMNYILAMHELRYLETRNIESAERYVMGAVNNVRAATSGPEANEHAFLRAFIDNGLAFLRARQHRYREALDLCEFAYDSVTDELGEDRHRLHRSVLQYNMAQIHVALEQFREGLACYATAIQMDPSYTEYHVESANILLRLGRYAEAIDCCDRAITCSPPYPEVYFTKAVCHAHLEQWAEALACSGVSLELDPNQAELHVARADIFALLEQPGAAIAEYDKAIGLAPDSIPMRVNRAVLHFNSGSFELALADMNDVIAREPQEAAHYENRAAIYQAIDRRDLHSRDLDMAERCRELV